MRYYSSTAAETTLTGSVNGGDPTIAVAAVTGFPGTTPFTLVIDPDLATEEIVTVTGVAGLTLSVTRGEDGSSDQAHSLGATVKHMMSARDLREPQEHIAASTQVHGLGAGVAVVGTTTTQTLTNKTMTGTSNTFSAIPSAAVTGLDTHTAATAAHGATGAVVGTTNAQTLTNKTISGASNTLSNIAQSSVTNLATDISTLQNRTPVGALMPYAGSAAPTGWLLCDGSAVSRSTYSALFSVCGTTYGAGDGSTTFNLPNLKGRIPVGIDTGQAEFDTRGETGGAKTHTLTASEIPAHKHVVDGVDGTGLFGAGVTSVEIVAPTTSSGTNRYVIANGTDHIEADYNTGGGGAHNNLQPYMALHYIIRAV